MLPTSPKRTPKIQSLDINSLISSTQIALLLENDERVEAQLQLELTRCKSVVDSLPESSQSWAKLYLTEVYRRKIISESNVAILANNVASMKATFEKAWAQQELIYETALSKMEHKYEVAIKEQKDKFESEQKLQLERFLDLDSPLFYRNLIEELEGKHLDQSTREKSTRNMRWRTIVNLKNFDSLRKLILAEGIDLMEFPRYVCDAFDDCSFTIHSYCRKFPNDLDGLKRRYRMNRYTFCSGKVAKVAEILQEVAILKLSPEASTFHAPRPHASRKVSSNVSHSKSRSFSSSSSAISVSDEGESRDARALRRDGSASLSSSRGSTSSSSENLRSLKNRYHSHSKLQSVAAETKQTNSGIKKSAHKLVASDSALAKTNKYDQSKKCDEDASRSHGTKSLREAARSDPESYLCKAETKPTNSGSNKSADELVVTSKSSALEKNEEEDDQSEKCDMDTSGSQSCKSLSESGLSSHKRQHEKSSSGGSDNRLKKLKKRRKKKTTHSHSRHNH